MAGVDPAKQTTALAGELDRQSRRINALENRASDAEGAIQSLACDVATLASYVAPGGDKKLRSWLLADNPKLASEDLKALAQWLDAVWLRYPDAVVPSCWAWHPALVEELHVLRLAHVEAFDPQRGTIAKAADWHDRLRPHTAARISAAYRRCDLPRHTPGGPAHQPAPSVPLTGHLSATAQAWATSKSTPTPTPDQLREADAYDQQVQQYQRSQQNDLDDF